MSRVFTSGLWAVLLCVSAVTTSAHADCVNRNGDSVDGVRERHSIGKYTTETRRFVRVTDGTATIQVDVRGSYKPNGQPCSRKNDVLSFEILTSQKKNYVRCLNPSEKGPASFLSCYFRVSLKNNNNTNNNNYNAGSTKRWIEIDNPNPCRVEYDLICRDGRYTP